MQRMLRLPIDTATIEAIERATVAAVAPDTVAELGGWLVPLDAGTIGRAKSAVPLNHDRADPAIIATIEACYHARGLPPAFRLADDPRLEPLHGELRHRGYLPQQPTLVKIGTTAAVRTVTNAAPAEVTTAPDTSWTAVFLGPGFDLADGARRIAAFRRAPDAVFAGVREAGGVVAVGVAAFGFGWASVHGMRTEQGRRGEGLGARVLAGLAEAARTRGIEHVFLQVEEGNTPALTLYRRAGFEAAWRYFYWRQAS